MDLKTIGKELFLAPDSESEKQLEVLKNCPLFEGLPEKELDNLQELLHERTFDRDEIIVNQGEPASAMFLIESGEVLIYKPRPDDEPREITRLNSGDFFGELAICDEHRRSASSAALSKTKLLVLFRQEFLSYAHQNKEAGFTILVNLAAMVGSRLKNINERCFELIEENEALRDSLEKSKQ